MAARVSSVSKRCIGYRHALLCGAVAGGMLLPELAFAQTSAAAGSGYEARKAGQNVAPGAGKPVAAAPNAKAGPLPSATKDAKPESGPVPAEEVVQVTAQRRSESIQKVPVSITAITAATITRTNIQGIEGWLAQTPNVTFVTNGSRDRKDISIRGISNQLNPYSDVRPSAFAFYIDDFSVVAGTSNPQVVDMQQIEVLRGPQGTYFGRNALGGAINVTTKKPVQRYEAEASFGYSSFNTKTGSAVVNIPVVKDKFAIRLAGEIASSDGNIKNINPTGGGNDSIYEVGRIIARYTPDDRTTNDTTFSYSHEDMGMRSGVPTGFVTATWASIYYGGTPGFIGSPDGVGFFPKNDSRVNFNRPQSVGTDFWYVSDRLVHRFNHFNMTAVGGYVDASPFNYGDVDGSSYDYFYERDKMRHTSLNGELRFQSTDKSRLEWAAGVNAGRDTGSTAQYTYAGTAGLLGLPTDFPITGTKSNAHDIYEAAFGQLSYHIIKGLTATVGLRYTHEWVQQQYLAYSGGALVQNINASKGFNNFSPRFNISYEYLPDAMLYATVSRGFKAGGIQTAYGTPNTYYKPETLWSYELGTKFQALNNRLRMDVSGFYMDWNNVQEQTQFMIMNNGNFVGVDGINNAAKARSYGFDGSFDFQITHNLIFSGHGGYLNARFDKFRGALIDGSVIDASGKQLINAPKWSGGADLEYRFPVFADYHGFIRPEWRFQSKKINNMFGLKYTQYPFVSPAYNVFNLRLGFENKKYSLIFYAENIGKMRYFENAYEKAFVSGVQVEPAFRSFGLTLRAKYF